MACGHGYVACNYSFFIRSHTLSAPFRGGFFFIREEKKNFIFIIIIAKKKTKGECILSNPAYKKIRYKGEEYTLKQLSELHGVPPTAINNRLLSGWNIEEAITVPSEGRKKHELPPAFQNENIVYVIFEHYIPGVYSHMQPKLNKPYLIKAYASTVSAPTYMITLENGKPLIVRKGEFKIIKIIPGKPQEKENKEENSNELSQ